MVCARRPKGELALLLTLLPVLLGLSLWLALTGGGAERLIGVLGLFLWLCVLLNAVGPGRYCALGSELVWGRKRLPLTEIQGARVAPGSRCPLFPELRLVLTPREGDGLALPLSYAGWEEVYEAIRAARPDLGLPPWWEAPEIRRALKTGGRPLLHLPKGATSYRENGTVALLASALLFLALTLLGPFVPRPLDEVWVGVVVFATLTLYHRLAKPRVLLEDPEGRFHLL